MNQLDAPSLCVECQGGRLIGQAVLEPDGGWRYFLACTDCDTKVELGQDSAEQPEQTDADERTCRHPGCTTLLSAYNDTTECWAHTDPSFQ